MSLPILIAPSFDRTLIEIYNYISERSFQAAEDFADGVNEQILIIAKHPSAYPNEPRLKSKRRLYRFKKYKKNYKIIFKVLKTKVVFIAVIYAGKGDKAYSELRTASY